MLELLYLLRHTMTTMNEKDYNAFTTMMRDDPRKLDILYETKIGKNPALQNIWFILYKEKFPRQLMAAYESSYAAQFPAPTPFSEIHSVIDIGLGINYATAMNQGTTFYRVNDENSFLRPSPRHVTEWTVFQVKMRRLAFRLFRDMIGSSSSSSIHTLGQYVMAVTSAEWTSEKMDEEAVVAFFSPLPATTTNALVETIKKYYALVNQEIMFENETPFLSHFATPEQDRQLIIDRKKFEFINSDNDAFFRQQLTKK